MAEGDGYRGPNGKRRTQLDLDVRGILALLSVVGLFGIVFTQLAQGLEVKIPAEVAGIVGGAMGFYFGGKGAAGGEVVAQQVLTTAAQGVQLDEIHKLVNERLDKALGVIDEQRRELVVARDKTEADKVMAQSDKTVERKK